MITNLNFDQQNIEYQSLKRTDKQAKESEYVSVAANELSLSLMGNKVEIVNRTLELESRHYLMQTLTGVDLSFLNVSAKSAYTKTTLPVDISLDMDYWGAEKTSSRIADLASSMAELWKINNPGKSKGEFEKFLSTLKDAVQQGFDAANNILQSAVSGSVQDLVKNTYDQTMEKIARNFTSALAEVRQPKPHFLGFSRL